MVGDASDRSALQGQGEGLSSVDTIVAIATPPGRGGVGIVRVSGPRAHALVAPAIGQRRMRVRRPFLATFHDRDGQAIDEGIVLAYAAPRSFTGEDVVELHAHGSPVVLDLLVDALLAGGARLAQPGEFSLRAFLNDKIDLAQAEAIADLIDAGSRAGARAAAGSLAGAFSREIEALKQALIEVRVIVEASIDFPDEDIELLSEYRLRERVLDALAQLDRLRAEAEAGAQLRQQPKVVIAGAPNAGKSSLLNRLSGRDAAIVTDIAGTTRDLVRERFELDGMQLELVDTAGLRTSDDPIEREGIRRARQEVAEADLVLLVVDASAAANRDAAMALRTAGLDDAGSPCIVVYNKIDATAEAAGAHDGALSLSARTGEGIDALVAALRARLGSTDHAPRFLARRRHLDALARCAGNLSAGAAWLGASPRLELAAEELKLAQACLGEIVGDVSSDELLGHIFSSFCIGK